MPGCLSPAHPHAAMHPETGTPLPPDAFLLTPSSGCAADLLSSVKRVSSSGRDNPQPVPRHLARGFSARPAGFWRESAPGDTAQSRSRCRKRLCRATHGSREPAERSGHLPALLCPVGTLCLSFPAQGPWFAVTPAGARPPGETPLMCRCPPGGTGTSRPGRSALPGQLPPSSPSLRGPGAPQGVPQGRGSAQPCLALGVSCSGRREPGFGGRSHGSSPAPLAGHLHPSAAPTGGLEPPAPLAMHSLHQELDPKHQHPQSHGAPPALA